MLLLALYFSSITLNSFPRLKAILHDKITERIQEISSQSVLFYAPNSHLAVINKGCFLKLFHPSILIFSLAILYIRENELARWIRIAFVCESEASAPSDFVSNVRLLGKETVRSLSKFLTFFCRCNVSQN